MTIKKDSSQLFDLYDLIFIISHETKIFLEAIIGL